MTDMASDWDPLGPESADNPQAYDDEVRGRCPVAYSSQWGGFWALFKNEDITRALRDPDTFSSVPDIIFPPRPTPFPWVPLQADPPQHRQYRSPLVPFFRGQRIASFVPRLTEMTNDLIDGFIERGTADVAHELNIPLPAMGICLILGLPEENWTKFYNWTTTFNSSVENGDMEALAQASGEVEDFASELIAERRKNPTNDVVSAMTTATVDGRAWTDEEIRGAFTLVFSAGHETTADALTNAIRYLAVHQEDRRALAENPDLIAKAAPEFVRLLSPVRGLRRTTTRQVEVRGRVIPADSPVVMMWGGGSRDEDVFENPSEFHCERDNLHRSTAFGAGMHRCIGEEFGKLEMTVVLTEFLRRIPDFELAGSEKRSTWPTSGFHHLQINFPRSARIAAHSQAD